LSPFSCSGEGNTDNPGRRCWTSDDKSGSESISDDFDQISDDYDKMKSDLDEVPGALRDLENTLKDKLK
jgi:hypothetical protein